MTAPTARQGAAPFAVGPPVYQLPSEIRLGPVRLQISDLSRSIEYYERVIGFHAIEKSSATAILGAHDEDIPLIELRERRGVTPVPRRGRLGLYHFAILLPDRASLGRFVAHLSQLGERAGMADHLVSEALYLSDPDGLGIEVYADRPRSEWRMQGRSLAMATLPLDVEDLARAGARGTWIGAPKGTRMGHVHLSVSNLEQAASFYHIGLGLDKIALEFPGALFMSAGGYHHHLGTNTWAAGAEVVTDADARLLEWTVVLPSAKDVGEATQSMRAAGFGVRQDGDDAVSTDPWGTGIRLTVQR